MDHPHSLANTADGTDSIGDRRVGPWHVHPTDNTVVVDAYGDDVAAVIGNYDEEWIDMEANAHLIAAAPALYEALEEADDFISEIDYAPESLRSRLRNALRLARGEKK